MTTDARAPLFGELPPGHRSGFVGIVGRPNVGKSTLLNGIVGRKIAAVTPKPQTTRRRLLGIKTLPAAQILFVDTPGIHTGRDLLNERMVERALQSLPESDAVVWVVDALHGVDSGDRSIAALLPPAPKPVIAALNKIDGLPKAALLPLIATLAGLVPERAIVPISARTGENVEALLDAIVATLPEGPRYYPPDELTDATERDIAAEIVREKVMLETRDEIPYSVAVTVDGFEETPRPRPGGDQGHHPRCPPIAEANRRRGARQPYQGHRAGGPHRDRSAARQARLPRAVRARAGRLDETPRPAARVRALTRGRGSGPTRVWRLTYRLSLRHEP